MFLTEEEERRARNANLKREVVEGPLLRFMSRGEKVKVPLIVEVEISAPTPGYKRPYVPSPLTNTSRPASNTLPNPPLYSPFGTNPYTRLPPTPSNSGAPGTTRDAHAQASRYTSSPYYYPLPNPPTRTINPLNTVSVNNGVHSRKLVTQAKNYVILETPSATPSEDYQYLFGDHVDWENLKVLPKNHPSSIFALF